MRQYDETGETLDATGDLSNAYHAADGRRREASEVHPVNLNPYRSGSKPECSIPASFAMLRFQAARSRCSNWFR